jgi:hypothetical protein
LIYRQDIDEFESSFYKKFFSTLVINLSKQHETYEKVSCILLELQSQLKKDKSDLFYLNLLIQESHNSYINSLSKPYSFSKAKAKVDSLV